jgi:hypothetical protein
VTFKFRVEKILALYKNGIEVNPFVQDTFAAYGKQRNKMPEEYFDPTAQYFVTYIAQPYQLSASVQSAEVEYATNLKTTVERNTQDIADVKRDVSVIAGTYAKKAQQQWIAPTLLNGWVNYGGDTEPAGYMKDEFGFVYLKGLVKGGALGTTMFILPKGYRPAYAKVWPVITAEGSNNLVGRLGVSPDGSVTLNYFGGTTYVYLDVPPFRAEQ